MPSPERSGGDVYTARMLKEIDNRSYMLDLVTAGGANNLLNDLKVNTRKLLFLDNLTARNAFSISCLYLMRTVYAAFIAISLRRSQYDTAIAASPFIYDIIPVILCRAETKVVTIFHIIPDRKAKSFLAAVRFNLARMEQWLSLIMIGWFFDTVLVGNADVQAVLHERFPEKKLIIAHAGIDTGVIDKVDSGERDYSTALFVGRLTQQKGIYDLIEVAEYMKHENFKVLIVGDGQDKKKLQGLIESHKLTNIEMLGFVSQDEKYRLMKQAGIFIFPSYEEGWGIAPAEAMYCGSLCIMYELPHYRSIFGEFPVYVGLGDQVSLSQAVMLAYKDSQRAQEKQIDFMYRYNDKEVVKLILDELTLPVLNR